MAKLSEYDEAIEKGAALLDEKQPGWHNRIDLDVLNLGDCRFCVLGQTFSAQALEARREGFGIWPDWFTVGARTLFPAATFIGYDPAAAASHGFSGGEEFFSYHTLTRKWKSFIRRRLSRQSHG